MDINRLKTEYRSIDCCIINWQKFNRSKKKYTQCHRCQQYGQVSRNCEQKHKCVKCIEDHRPGECKKDRNVDLAQCVNCNEAHPANSKNCKSFLDYKKKLEFLKGPRKIPNDLNKVNNKVNDSKPFRSTPAPWTNLSQMKDFPKLPHSNINVRMDNLRNIVDYTDDSQNNHSSFGEDLNSLNQKFSSIPNIGETMRLYSELIVKLSGTKDHGERLAIIIHYTTPKYD